MFEINNKQWSNLDHCEQIHKTYICDNFVFAENLQNVLGNDSQRKIADFEKLNLIENYYVNNLGNKIILAIKKKSKIIFFENSKFQ